MVVLVDNEVYITTTQSEMQGRVRPLLLSHSGVRLKFQEFKEGVEVVMNEELMNMNKSVSVGDRIEPSDLLFMNRWQDVKLMPQRDNHEEVWEKQHLFRATEMDITIRCFLLTQGYCDNTCANCKNLKVWRECNKL